MQLSHTIDINRQISSQFDYSSVFFHTHNSVNYECDESPKFKLQQTQTKKEKAVMILLNRLLSRKVVLSIGLLTDSFSVSVRMYNTVEFELNYYNNLLYFISSFCCC